MCVGVSVWLGWRGIRVAGRSTNSCLVISLLYASTCFEHYVLIIRRSKLYYTASGIITPTGVSTKSLPTTPETPLTRCSQLHGNGRDANIYHQQQHWYESFKFQEALRQATRFICTAANTLKPKEFSYFVILWAKVMPKHQSVITVPALIQF